MDLGFSSGDIKLNSANNVYYSGQTIIGEIVFKLLDTERITGLNIQCLGYAKVSWSETQIEKRYGINVQNNVEYKSQEQYFDNSECLIGKQGATELRSGQHSIPFKFQIPPTAPSSFRSDKGEITYEIRAYLEYPDITKKRGELVKTFEVVAPFDLNKEDPRINHPIKLSFEEEYGCDCLCTPSIISVEVETAAAAACPGQFLPVTIRAKNDANFEAQYVRVQLLSKQLFRSQYPVAEMTNPEVELASLKSGAILTGVKRNYQLFLQIPDMIAPNLTNCSIIDVQYILQVTIKMPGLHSDLVDSSPFFIGLKPFSDFGKGPYVHPMAHSLPAGPIPDYVKTNPTPNPVKITEIGFVESTPTTLNQSFKPQQSNYSQYPGTGFNYNQNPPYPPVSSHPHPPPYGYPNHPTSAFPNQPVSGYPNQPVPGYPNHPVPGYPNHPVPGYPNQPVPGYPNPSVPGYPNPPVPGYPNQPVPGYPNRTAYPGVI